MFFTLVGQYTTLCIGLSGWNASVKSSHSPCSASENVASCAQIGCEYH